MKKLGLISLLLIGFVLFSCSKDENTTTTTSTTTSGTKATVFITVENLSGIGQANIKVDMFDKEISSTQANTTLKSATTNSSGKATFDMQDLATDSPKTYYFGVFQQNGNSYELKGSKKVDNILKGTEVSSNLILLN